MSGERMRNLLGLLILSLVFVGCKSEGGGGGSKKKKSKAPVVKGFWSYWENQSSVGDDVDLTAGEFSVAMYIDLNVAIDQDWIDLLNTAGLDTTGLVDGDSLLCTYGFIVNGDNSSGAILMQREYEIDTPDMNHCLIMDNFCDTGNICNLDDVHSYTIIDNTLSIDWFDSSDFDYYGTEVLR